MDTHRARPPAGWLSNVDLRETRMALIPPIFIDCVVAIGSRDSEGNACWIASGFLYGRSQSQAHDQHHVFIVTNRHVVEGLEGGVLRFNPQGDHPAREFPFSALNPTIQEWFYHPREDVDVAVFPINVRLADLNLQLYFFQKEPHAADVARMTAIDVREGDPVYALGFPLGIVGPHRNAVIARMGCVAQLREVIARRSDTFLIDASIFPGNSGGPVLLKPEAIFVPGTRSQPTCFLIGIIAGYVPYMDVAISQQTKRPRIVFEENSGLASVHPVDLIEETLDSFYRVVASRETSAGGSNVPGTVPSPLPP